MKFWVYRVSYPSYEAYFFINSYTGFWSSSFDSLGQLVDVGEDDPDHIINPKLTNYTAKELEKELDEDESREVVHLCSVNKLEDMYKQYPEKFL